MNHHHSYEPVHLHQHVTQPPMDVDAMLYDVSNRMARAQLARQVSNSSSIYRQRAAKIMKTNSAGTSPQNVQRRRMTASHRTPQYRAELYQEGFRRSQQEFESHPNYSAAQQPYVPRPVSWHPSSVAFKRSSNRLSNLDSHRLSNLEAQQRHSLTNYHTATINGLPTPMTQPDISSDASLDPHFSLDTPSVPYPHPPTTYHGLQLSAPNAGPIYPPATQFPQTQTWQYSHHPMTQASQMFPPMDYTTLADYSTQTWAESLSTFPSHTAPPTPDFLPIQNPSDMWQPVPSTTSPLPKPQTKELIGMGLYDAPDTLDLSLSSMCQSGMVPAGGDPHRISMGKGLKLEETWEPPESDKSSDGEEEEEDEEGEEEEGGLEDAECIDDIDDATPLSVPTVAKALKPDFEPAYADLSNQSFFFEDEQMVDSTGFEMAGWGLPATMQSVAWY